MEGLETNVQLVSLYLQENLIARIENIDTLSNLHTLQLSDNCISSIENLSFNVKLDSLYLKSNRIGRNGVSDLIGLLECPSIACLDI
jgi:Leucine-rich repeat (LRR) protein